MIYLKSDILHYLFARLIPIVPLINFFYREKVATTNNYHRVYESDSNSCEFKVVKSMVSNCFLLANNENEYIITIHDNSQLWQTLNEMFPNPSGYAFKSKDRVRVSIEKIIETKRKKVK